MNIILHVKAKKTSKEQLLQQYNTLPETGAQVMHCNDL